MPRVPCASSNHNNHRRRRSPSTELNGISWRRVMMRFFSGPVFSTKNGGRSPTKWNGTAQCVSVPYIHTYVRCVCVCVCVKYTFRNWLKPARELLLFKRAHTELYLLQTDEMKKKKIKPKREYTYIPENHTHTETYKHTQVVVMRCLFTSVRFGIISYVI